MKFLPVNRHIRISFEEHKEEESVLLLPDDYQKKEDPYQVARVVGVSDDVRFIVVPGDKVYKGMIVGENARDNDLPVNPIRAKHLNNFRSQGDGKGIILNAPMILSLERALEYIAPDEYVEATPSTLRLRKKILNEHDRKRSEKQRSLQLA